MADYLKILTEDIHSAAIATLDARHLFYGISMLDKYKGTGWKKIYLISGMCDESFSINYTAKIPENIDNGWFMFFAQKNGMTMSLTQQAITILTVVLGTLITRFLPFIVFPAGKPTPKYIQYLGKVLP